MKISPTRRNFLRASSGLTLSMPFLASAQEQSGVNVPQRLVIYQTGEGNLPKLWKPPVLANDALELSEMLQPLAAHKDKMVVVSGVSNKISPLHSSNGHNAPGHTIMSAALVDTTGTGVFDKNRSVSQASRCLGPSIDHYLADQLKTTPPINLAVGGSDGGENRMWYKVKPPGATGANPEAAMSNDPVAVFKRYLGSSTGTNTTRADRFLSQRKSVLDGVLESFNAFKITLGKEDQIRLESHADAIRSIEKGLLVAKPAECKGLVQTIPQGWSLPRWPDSFGMDKQAYMMTDLITQLLSCGVSRVVTLQDTNYDNPNFEFLSVGPVKGWHGQVHNDAVLGLGYATIDQNPTLKAGFLHYARVFNRLLDSMDLVVEPNGKTLLDNSLVLWISEFGSGQAHRVTNLPVVLAGGAQGKIKTGRHLVRPTSTTGDLYTSILNAFGIPATSFGYNEMSGLNNGGIPGLVG